MDKIEIKVLAITITVTIIIVFTVLSLSYYLGVCGLRGYFLGYIQGVFIAFTAYFIFRYKN